MPPKNAGRREAACKSDDWGEFGGSYSDTTEPLEETTLKALPPESVLGSVKYAIRFLFNPRSHLTVILSWVWKRKQKTTEHLQKKNQ